MTAKVIGWKINDTECFDKSISLKSVEVLLKHHKECLLRITQPVQCAKLLQRSDELNLVSIFFSDSCRKNIVFVYVNNLQNRISSKINII